MGQARQLDACALQALLHNEICVLRVPEFCPPQVQARLLAFARQSQLEPYQAIAMNQGRQTVKHLGVHRLGSPYNLTYSGGSVVDYYAKASWR